MGGGAVPVLRRCDRVASPYFLGEDRQRRLWIGTGDGVDVVTSGGIDHFDESDGLAGNDSAATVFMVDDDGSLWLGSTGGATHVLAQYYDGPPRPPRVSFLDGRLGDQPIGNAETALEVPHDRNALVRARIGAGPCGSTRS